MAVFTTRPLVSPLALLLLSFLLALSSPSSLVHAADYSFQTPTAATRWVTGQPGLVSIVVNKAQAVKITLERGSSGFFGVSDVLATIRDGAQLAVAPATAPIQITDFVVPAVLAAGDNYFVKIHVVGSLGRFTDVDSSNFQISTPATPTGNSTLPVPSSTLLPSATVTTPASSATPTLPAGQTCNDVMEQCAAQGLAYVDATATAPCSCGVALIVPTVVKSSAPGSIKSTVKSTFQSTGGPTAALAVLLLVVLTMF